MNLFPTRNDFNQDAEIVKNSSLVIREQTRRKQIVGTSLLVIVLFQFVELPGALMMGTAMDIGTVSQECI